MNSDSRLITNQAYVWNCNTFSYQQQSDGTHDSEQKQLKTLAFLNNQLFNCRLCPICQQDISIQIQYMNQQQFENYVKCIKNPFTNESIMFHCECLKQLHSQIQSESQAHFSQNKRSKAESASFSEAIQLQKAAQITMKNQDKYINIRLQARLNEIFLEMLPRFSEGVQPPFRNVMSKVLPSPFFTHLNEAFIEIKIYSQCISNNADDLKQNFVQCGRVGYQLNPQSYQIEKNMNNTHQQNNLSQEQGLFHLQFNLPIEGSSEIPYYKRSTDLFNSLNCEQKGQQDDSFYSSYLKNNQNLIHNLQNDTLIIEYAVYHQSFGSQKIFGTFSLSQLLRYQQTQNPWISIDVPSLTSLFGTNLFKTFNHTESQTSTFSDTVFLYFNILRSTSRTLKSTQNQQMLNQRINQIEGISLSHLNIQIEFAQDLQYSQYFQQNKNQDLKQPSLYEQAPPCYTQSNSRPQQHRFQSAYFEQERMIGNQKMLSSQLQQQQRQRLPYYNQLTPQGIDQSHLFNLAAFYPVQQVGNIVDHTTPQQHQYLYPEQPLSNHAIYHLPQQSVFENTLFDNQSPFYYNQSLMRTVADSQIQNKSDSTIIIPINKVIIRNVSVGNQIQNNNDFSELNTQDSTKSSSKPSNEGISLNDQILQRSQDNSILISGLGARKHFHVSCQTALLTDHAKTQSSKIDNQLAQEFSNLSLQTPLKQDSNSLPIYDETVHAIQDLTETSQINQEEYELTVKSDSFSEGQSMLKQIRTEDRLQPLKQKSSEKLPNIDNLFAQLKTQKGSRHLQNFIKKIQFKELSQLVETIQDHIDELMIDLYGNYFCQTLFRIISFDQRASLLESLKNSFIRVSCNSIGTHSLQRLLDVICETSEKETVFESIKDHIDILAFNTYGNFVLIKVMIILNSPDTKQFEYFIIKKLLSHINELINDQQGVCIVNKMIQFVKDNYQRQFIIVHLVNNLTALMTNTYAIYAVTTAIETWSEYNFFEPLLVQIKERLQQFAIHQTSANVIEKCVEKANIKLILDFAEVLQREGTMKSLLKCPHTFFIILKIYNRLVTHEQRLSLSEVLSMNIQFINDKALKEKCIALVACNGHPTEGQPYHLKGNTSRLSKKQLRKQDRKTENNQYKETLTDLLKVCDKSSSQESQESSKEYYMASNKFKAHQQRTFKHEMEQQPQDSISQTKYQQQRSQYYDVHNDTQGQFDFDFDFNDYEAEFNQDYSRQYTKGRINNSKKGWYQRDNAQHSHYSYSSRQVKISEPEYQEETLEYRNAQEQSYQDYKTHPRIVQDKNHRHRIYYNNEEAPAYLYQNPKLRH